MELVKNPSVMLGSSGIVLGVVSVFYTYKTTGTLNTKIDRVENEMNNVNLRNIENDKKLLQLQSNLEGLRKNFKELESYVRDNENQDKLVELDEEFESLIDYLEEEGGMQDIRDSVKSVKKSKKKTYEKKVKKNKKAKYHPDMVDDDTLENIISEKKTLTRNR
jgi:TolA-binding protein